jgi:hypothetical protein
MHVYKAQSYLLALLKCKIIKPYFNKKKWPFLIGTTKHFNMNIYKNSKATPKVLLCCFIISLLETVRN